VQVLTAYRKAVSGTLVHIESPPPIPSVAHIEAYADAAFAGLVTERGVSPAAFRYKFWRLQSLLYRLSCQRLGVAFLPVPAELCDAEGMLVEAAWGHDATHANTLFGRCVLPRLREMAARC